MNNVKSDSRIVHIKGAAQHASLMLGLTAAIRLSIGNPDKQNGDEDKLIALIELLEDLIPDERELKH